MQLNDYEKEMLAGEYGKAKQFGMQQALCVGNFFDATDMVEVSQVHLMADPESLGDAGLKFLESLVETPKEERTVVVPAVTDPRGVDLGAYKKLGQTDDMADLEIKATNAFRSLGFMMTDTCINYQTICPPVQGEHVAFGDTGSSIYANSVQGARTNFEGGPSALAAALTGRTPRYGYHLDQYRYGSCLFDIKFHPKDLSYWGALGAYVGREMSSYWEVPVISGIEETPTSDEMKQFGAALASFGSTPLFHMIGITPEAPNLKTVFNGATPKAVKIVKNGVDELIESYMPSDDKLDVVVFAGPQLSLMEMQTLAEHLRGRKISGEVALIATTSPEIKFACDRMGLTDAIETAGGMLLSGVCFYQMYAREIGEANDWKRLMSNSAKLVNILGGYGYEPMLASMKVCVECAIQGRIIGNEK